MSSDTRVGRNRPTLERRLHKILDTTAPPDILAARGNGITSICVKTGITPVEELAALQPDHMLRDLTELRLRFVV